MYGHLQQAGMWKKKEIDRRPRRSTDTMSSTVLPVDGKTTQYQRYSLRLSRTVLPTAPPQHTFSIFDTLQQDLSQPQAPDLTAGCAQSAAVGFAGDPCIS